MLQEFSQLALANGFVGLAAGLIILVLILIARKAGLVLKGDQSRIANVILGVVVWALNPAAGLDVENEIVAVLASLFAALLYEFVIQKLPKKSVG